VLSQVDQIKHLCPDLIWSMRSMLRTHYYRSLQDFPETEAGHTTDVDEVDMVLLAQPLMMLRNIQKMESRLAGDVDEQGWDFYPAPFKYKSNLESIVMSKEPATENDIQQVHEHSHRMLGKMPAECCTDRELPKEYWCPDT
jgi:hypothetical protein